MTALFTIRTANANVGGANRYHNLDVRAQIGDRIEDSFGATVRVDVSYGRDEVYRFTPVILDMGSEHELITLEELTRRRALAEHHGQNYDEMIAGTDGVWIVEWSAAAREAYAACNEVIKAFKALSDLDLFRLPVTF